MGTSNSLARTLALCRDGSSVAAEWILARNASGWIEPLATIAVGGAAYGFAIGAWRAPELALFVALKLPILLVLTALVDALLNGLWAARFGIELSLAQSLRAVLASFALAAVVLGALAPVVFYFDWALPPWWSSGADLAHALIGLAHVVAISFAGIVAVLRQRRWIVALLPANRRSGRVVFLWLAVNLFVGAQLSWNLRPWFGTPRMPVQFLREHPLDGTFYESVFRMLFQLAQ